VRRQVAVLLALLLSAAALASAEEPRQRRGLQDDPLVLRQMIAGQWEPLLLERVDGPPGPFAPSAEPAEDFCHNAPNINVPDGGATVTNSMVPSDPTDPDLDCMWGNPSRIKGWRTVWYKLEATRTELITVDTWGSNYDTVLAIYDGDDGCNNLVQLACNDDSNFFTSRASAVVRAGHTYYIEVADWQQAVSGDAVLSVLTERSTAPSKWEQVSGATGVASQRSRHAAVMVGSKLYLIGGQTVVSGNPIRTPSTDVYDTVAGTWTSLANMTTVGGPSDGLGYSNMPAAHVNGKIYVPSGYTGVDGTYWGAHMIYDISTDHWSDGVSNPFWTSNGGPSIYSAAVPYTGSDGAGYYLMGGLTGRIPPTLFWEARPELYRYRLSGGWQQVPALMQTGRFGHSAAMQEIGGDDHICVAGGIGDDGEGNPVTLGSTECFDIDSGVRTPRADLNIPRYFAGSAVDSGGNWYVFGGVDALGTPVPVTERYDREADRWLALDIRYYLVDPSRAWALGGFVGQTLWIAGGQTEGDQVINLVEKIDVPLPPILYDVPPVGYLPVVVKDYAAGQTNNTFADANLLPLNVPRQATFTGPEDVYDIYSINIPSLRSITLKLSRIPKDNEYDLHLYSNNKLWLASSTQPGNNDKTINHTLGTGRYFVVVERVFPLPGTDPGTKKYQIEAQG
jgi:hypothetical protein